MPYQTYHKKCTFCSGELSLGTFKMNENSKGFFSLEGANTFYNKENKNLHKFQITFVFIDLPYNSLSLLTLFHENLTKNP